MSPGLPISFSTSSYLFLFNSLQFPFPFIYLVFFLLYCLLFISLLFTSLWFPFTYMFSFIALSFVSLHFPFFSLIRLFFIFPSSFSIVCLLFYHFLFFSRQLATFSPRSYSVFYFTFFWGPYSHVCWFCHFFSIFVFDVIFYLIIFLFILFIYFF